MQSNHSAPPLALAWAGVLPFVGLLVVAFFDHPPAWLKILLIGYAVLILAFMAGTLWMQALLEPSPNQRNRRQLLVSNALVLAAWPALLLPITAASAWLAVLFAVHLGIEQPWRSKSWPTWYRRLRLQVSATVISLLLMATLLPLLLRSSLNG